MDSSQSSQAHPPAGGNASRRASIAKNGGANALIPLGRRSNGGGGGGNKSEKGPKGSKVVAAKVPNKPTPRDKTRMLQLTHGIGGDEVYGDDERKLNQFLVQHPMLSLEATSQKTLQIIADMYKERGACEVPTLPVVGKSYDDGQLRPPNKTIGERECACGTRCMATFLARWRHGPDTDLAFVCCEYLLPQERETFLAGGGLPPRRKKCLLCTRYFTSYLYYKARMDPNFKLHESGIAAQSFANSVAAPAASADDRLLDERELMDTQAAPFSQAASLVSTKDGYLPSAMLFVDEQFWERESSRSGPLSSLMWQPIVKFCSKHYKFVKTESGTPSVVQVNVGSHELFGACPVAQTVAPLGPPSR